MTATDLAAPATSFTESDRLLARLSDRKTAWTQVSIPQRIAYVQRCITRVLKVAESWADACSLGHAVMHHAGSSANRTVAFEFSGAGDCRLALRDRRCQSVGRCCRLFDDERDVESIPRPCPRRYSVGASGRGVVHNAYLFDRPQKSVIRAPFRIWPLPLWFTGHRTLRSLARRLVEFEVAPAWYKVPAMIWDAVRG